MTQFDLALKQIKGQPRVIIYINFLKLDSLMLHAKLQNHRSSGSGVEEF